MHEKPTVITERVDDIPLLLAHLERMGVQRLLDEHFLTHGNWAGLSLGWIAVVWLTHILSEADHRLNQLPTGAFATPIYRSQIYYLFFRQFQKHNLHSAFWRRSATGAYKSYSRYHSSIGCVDKGWLSTGKIADKTSLSERGTAPRVQLSAATARDLSDTVRHVTRQCAMARLLCRLPADVFQCCLNLLKLLRRLAPGRIIPPGKEVSYLV